MTINLKFIIAILCFCLFVNIASAQSAKNKEAVQMLKEFYTVYNTAWATAKYPRLQKKLDSLQRQYCTLWLRKQLKESAKGEGAEHDLLINDEYTDVAHLKTLRIVKDTAKLNSYIVSYVDHTTTPAYKPIDKTVVIHVTVAKENGSCKIANAYGDAVSLN